MKVEKGKGKVVEGVGDTVTAGGDDIYVVAAVVIKGGAKVESPFAMGGPGGAGIGGVKSHDQLARGVDWVGGKIKGEAVEAGPGRESGVRGVGAEIVEGELSVGKKFVPEVGGKVRMARGEDGDKVVFGSAEVAFGKVGAVIVGGDVLDREVLTGKELTEGEGGFVVND